MKSNIYSVTFSSFSVHVTDFVCVCVYIYIYIYICLSLSKCWFII